MDIFRTDIPVVTPELIGMPPRELRFDLMRVESFIPAGTLAYKDNATCVNPSASPAYVRLIGSIYGVGRLDLAHHCQPVIEHLGYIRNITFSRRKLILKRTDTTDNALVEFNDVQDLARDSFLDGEGHEVIVKSPYGFSTRLRYTNGRRTIDIAVDKVDPTVMTLTHQIDVNIDVCFSNEAAAYLYRKLNVDSTKKDAA